MTSENFKSKCEVTKKAKKVTVVPADIENAVQQIERRMNYILKTLKLIPIQSTPLSHLFNKYLLHMTLC